MCIGGVEIYLHAFLLWVIDGVDGQFASQAALPLGYKPPGAYRMVSCTKLVKVSPQCASHLTACSFEMWSLNSLLFTVV